MSRGDLTDARWRIFDPLFPDRGERGPEIEDKQRTVQGILWVLRTGAPWCDRPERYGNWNSGYVRFSRRRRLGVRGAAFEILASLGPPAGEDHAIDTTIVRTHQHAAGVGSIAIAGLAKDFTAMIASATAILDAASVMLLTRRLARQS